MLIKLRKSQSTAEYSILFGVIIAAAVAMQTYVKRSLNAKIKDASDAVTSVTGEVTDGVQLGTTQQYEPYYTNTYSKVTTNEDSLEKEVNAGGDATTTMKRTYDAESTDITDYDIGYKDQ